MNTLEQIAAMTAHEKRLAVAGIMGDCTEYVCDNHSIVPRDRIKDGMGCPWCSNAVYLDCPEYSTSLDAMAEIEPKADHPKAKEYLAAVALACGFDNSKDGQTIFNIMAAVAYATADQRATAFIFIHQ